MGFRWLDDNTPHPRRYSTYASNKPKPAYYEASADGSWPVRSNTIDELDVDTKLVCNTGSGLRARVYYNLSTAVNKRRPPMDKNTGVYDLYIEGDCMYGFISFLIYVLLWHDELPNIRSVSTTRGRVLYRADE
jgi:hypothetical protein